MSCKFMFVILCLIGAITGVTSFLNSNVGSQVRTVLPTTQRKRSQQFGVLMVSSGFSFQDGEQILVSVQKPLGILLEQDQQSNDENTSRESAPPIVVTEVDPNGSAGRAGIQVGDVLVAVQNASVETVELEYVLDFLQKCPRVVNLRLVRGGQQKLGRKATDQVHL